MQAIAVQSASVPPIVGPTPVDATQSRRHWVLENVLPWVTSLAVHTAIVIVVVVAARAVIQVMAPIDEPQVGTIEGIFKDTVMPPGQNPNGDTLKQIQMELPGATADGLAEAVSKNNLASLTGGGPGQGLMDDLIGAGQAAGQGGSGLTGIGIGIGPGGDNGGPPAMVGPARGTGLAGTPTFLPSGNARRIVFVCDATGTMLQKMALLKNELAKAVDNLRPVQSFNIVFYYDGEKAIALDPSQLLMATADKKRRALKFLDDISPTGSTDPLPAIKLAFKLQPQLIYFLSDGEFNNLRTYEEVIGEVAKANVGSKTKVNTILFDTYDQKAEEVMQEIATRHGGRYRYVKESDLNQ